MIRFFIQLSVFLLLFSSVQSFISFGVKEDHDYGPLVRIKTGLFIGARQKIFDKDLQAFLGIPYAKAPLGDLRFRRPVPLDRPVGGIYNATYFRSACSQQFGAEKPENMAGVGISEDCLYINVWTPTTRPDRHFQRLRPVLFFLYSSAFYKSSPAKPSNRGEYLAAVGDIVVVTPNYRLGFLGFAYGGDPASESMPGNMALHDVLFALQWTRDNIRMFGGDPEQITIAGSSAGAMFSSMLAMSPLVPTNWFNRIFTMSGVAANGLYIESAQTALAKTRYITDKVGCSNQTSSLDPLNQDEIECLRNSANLTAILELQDSDDLKSIGSSVLNGMMPIYGDSFMPVSPEVMLAKGKGRSHSSFVVGNELEEDGISKDFWPESKAEALSWLQEQFARMIKADENSSVSNDLNQMISRYFDDVDDDDRRSIKQAIVSLISDYTFNCPCLYFAEKWATQRNLAYLYRNEYVSSNFLKPDGSSERPFGPAHGDDTLLFMGQPFRQSWEYNQRDRNISLKLMRVFTNYIYGKRLTWPPILVDRDGEIKPLRLRITGAISTKLLDVDQQTELCKKWNHFRNYNSF